MRERLKKILPVLILSLIVLGVHANSLQGSFVWDDFVLVLFNQAYRHFDLHSIFFSLANGVEYLPVRDLSYAIDFAIWGSNPIGFHLTNLLLYWLTVITVYLLSKKLIQLLAGNKQVTTTTTAFLTAALFTVHPIHSEVVNFITCRNAILSGLFFFLAAWCFLCHLQREEKPRFWYGAALAAFVLSLFSKSTGIILPLIFLFFLPFFSRKNLVRHTIQALPFVFVSLIGFFLFKQIALKANIMNQDLLVFDFATLQSKTAVALQIPFFYLYKLFVPVAFSPEYDTQFHRSFASPVPIVCLFALILLCGAAFYWRRKIPYFSLSLGYYLLALIPVLNIFPTYPVVADRYAYLPSFAVFYFVASAGNALFQGRLRVWFYCAGTLLLLGCGILSWQQNTIWKSENSLWVHTLSVSPRAAKAYTNLGKLYFNAGDYQKAFALFYRATEIDPAYPHFDYFQGLRYYVLADYGSAINAFKRALARDSKFIEAHYQLGKSYEAVGRWRDAVATYREVLLSKGLDTGNYKTMARENLVRLGAK